MRVEHDVTSPARSAAFETSGPPAEAAPEALVRAARDGDVRAFELLVGRYHARALRFALNMGLVREDAEEVVQDAFVRVYRALPRFREGAAFEPWLFRILANRCRSAHARSKAWKRVTGDETTLALLPAPGAGTSAAVDAEALRGSVLRALETLPREQREAFLLRHVEDLDYDDMMRVTGAGLSALKMRVKRACDALRARLTGDSL
jgi:RNA polymerase sigma-70 factor (ECF subfamily)